MAAVIDDCSDAQCVELRCCLRIPADEPAAMIVVSSLCPSNECGGPVDADERRWSECWHAVVHTLAPTLSELSGCYRRPQMRSLAIMLSPSLDTACEIGGAEEVSDADDGRWMDRVCTCWNQSVRTAATPSCTYTCDRTCWSPLTQPSVRLSCADVDSTHSRVTITRSAVSSHLTPSVDSKTYVPELPVHHVGCIDH